MTTWTIHLLGPPGAESARTVAQPRTQKAWAVLASLLVPAVAQGEKPSWVSRETLSSRFWNEDDTDPKASLRACLASLKKEFEKGFEHKGEAHCLETDYHRVRITPGWFVTDLQRIAEAYQRARAAASVEERLRWLLIAEREMRGDFLEGWETDAPQAQDWLEQTRRYLTTRLLIPVLLLLAKTLQADGNPTAAFDTILRLPLFDGIGHREARQIAGELAALTHQQEVWETVEQVQSFLKATKTSHTLGLKKVTLKNARTLQSWFGAELAELDAGLQEALLRLAVFPAPFPVAMAEAVCGVSLSVLQVLEKTPFLQQTDDMFFLPPLARDCAWEQLASGTRRQLREQLAEFCIETLLSGKEPEGVLPAPLPPGEGGRPFLHSTLEWALAQSPAWRYIEFCDYLRYRGCNDLALLSVPHLRRIEADEAQPVPMRLHAGITAAFILMHADDNHGAIEALEMGLSLLRPAAERHQGTSIYTTLMRAYSNVGDWNMARQRGLQALEDARQMPYPRVEVHCLRFLGEISLNTGDLQEALERCEEALKRGQELALDAWYAPDALYWKSRVLYAMKRWEEALETVEAALTLWQDTDDGNVGHCVRVIGQIHMELGRYVEARMHLQHAIDLHGRSGRGRGRIVAIEALGDVFAATNKPTQAHPLYAECLAYYQRLRHAPGTERLQRKLAS